MSGEVWQDYLNYHENGKDPSGKGSTCKWVLPFSPDG